MLAVAETAYRLLERRRAGAGPGFTGGSLIKGAQGRHKACPYRGVWGEYCWLDTLLEKKKHGGEPRGALRGRSPCTREAACGRPHKCIEGGESDTDWSAGV